MSKSSIEWTEQTWNPVVGCSIVSPGCTNCYAMKTGARNEAMGISRYDGTTRVVNGNTVWTGKLAQAPDATLLQPLKRKKPTTYFVNSMGDLFHEDVPDAWIDRVFAVMALCPQHTFQVLTKRAQRMRDYLSDPLRHNAIELAAETIVRGPEQWGGKHVLPQLPLPNVWLGVSTERQQEADERIPLLLQTPAAVRFISAEPMLGPIDLLRIDAGEFGRYDVTGHPIQVFRQHPSNNKLDWVIVGGESGPHARAMHPDWARSIRDQCQAAGVAFFFKQWGEFAPCDGINVSMQHALCGTLGAPPYVERNWANALDFFQKSKRAQGASVLARVGKKSAGRLLDGVEHNAMPEVAR